MKKKTSPRRRAKLLLAGRHNTRIKQATKDVFKRPAAESVVLTRLNDFERTWTERLTTIKTILEGLRADWSRLDDRISILKMQVQRLIGEPEVLTRTGKKQDW